MVKKPLCLQRLFFMILNENCYVWTAVKVFLRHNKPQFCTMVSTEFCEVNDE